MYIDFKAGRDALELDGKPKLLECDGSNFEYLKVRYNNVQVADARDIVDLEITINK